jgi:hypothetical protein
MNSVKGDESFLKSQAVPEHLREVEDPYRDEDNDQNRRRVPLRSQSEYRDDLGDEEEGDDASSNILEDSWEVYEERLTKAFKRIGKSEDDGFDKGIGAGNLSMTAVSEKDAYRQAAAHTLDALTQKVKIPVRPSRDAILSLGPLIFPFDDRFTSSDYHSSYFAVERWFQSQNRQHFIPVSHLSSSVLKVDQAC